MKCSCLLLVVCLVCSYVHATPVRRNLLQTSNANITTTTKEGPKVLEGDKEEDAKEKDEEKTPKGKSLGILISRVSIFCIVLFNLIKCIQENKSNWSGWPSSMLKTQHAIMAATGFAIATELIDHVFGAIEVSGAYDFGETYESTITAMGYFSICFLCSIISTMYADGKPRVVLAAKINAGIVTILTLYLGISRLIYEVHLVYVAVVTFQVIKWRMLTKDVDYCACFQLIIFAITLLVCAISITTDASHETVDSLKSASLGVKALMLEPLLSLCFDVGSEFRERMEKAEEEETGMSLKEKVKEVIEEVVTVL